MRAAASSASSSSSRTALAKAGGPGRRAAARRPPPPRAALLDQLASFLGGGGGAEKRELAKEELLAVIAPLRRGLEAAPEDAARVEAAAKALERLNPTPKPLASELVNGRWELLYTTSQSILGGSRPFFLRPFGAIYQLIDAPGLRAANRESAPLWNTVSADLRATSASKLAVQFDEFGLFGGLIKIKAPAEAKGTLDTTYLDEEIRVSRGDKGNLFVLRMADPDAKP